MQARLTLQAGEGSPSVLELSPVQPATIGRSRENTIVIRGELVSRLHAKIFCEGEKWFVRDFGLNGTRIDGQRLTGITELRDGVDLAIGEASYRFSSSTPPITPIPGSMNKVLLEETCIDSDAVRPLSAASMQRTLSEITGTKVHELPPARVTRTAVAVQDETQLKVDELTALCRFMTAAVGVSDQNELIRLALRTILNQTSATIAGYLSLDPGDPSPKLVLPERAAVDVRLSRRLTERVRDTRRMVWLFEDEKLGNPSESLSAFHDAVCLPLANHSGEAYASIHVYRTGRGFNDRDVRFVEALAGFLSPTLHNTRNRRALEAENSRLRTVAPVADELIGDSAAITNLRMQIARAAPQPFTVMIHGESGSGKELVANALHRNSLRSSGPLVVMNCAAIAPTLLEAELFGYRKGAFSGADRDHPGLFEQADDGTLFLDEIAELSLECQAKLLRAIEGKAFRPVGGTKEIKVDVRVIAATHKDLDSEVKEGRFRQDLLFRLKVIALRVPPLRDHAEDIPELARFFLERLSGQCRRTFKLTPLALRHLLAYAWPGNVRQLRAVLESAAVMSELDLIDADVLPLGNQELESAATPAEISTGDFPNSLDMDELETWAIRKAIQQTGGNVSQAARVLGMSRDTLHTKLKKKSINREALLQNIGLPE